MSTSENTKSSKWITYLIEGAILVVALVLVLAIRFGVYVPALVTSRSMLPTLHMNDRVLVDHRDSLSGTWRRGDIVLFSAPDTWVDESERAVPAANREQLIKRVIGLPGEQVDVLGSQVWINGQLLQESYISPTPEAEPRPLRVVLGKGQYFVMGDNRTNSQDSRELGPVNNSDVIGRALRVLWPPGRTGTLPRPSYSEP
jgi:signal peptidase I